MVPYSMSWYIHTRYIFKKQTKRKQREKFVFFNHETMQQQHVPSHPPNLKNKEPTTIYISRIPCHLDEDALYDDFKDFGRVLATKVFRLRRPMSTGLLPKSGFVEFESRTVAENALTALQQDGYYKGIKMRVSWARRSLSESLSQTTQETYVVGRGKLYCNDQSSPSVCRDGLPNHMVMREAKLWYKHIQDYYMQQEQVHASQAPQMYDAIMPTHVPAAVIHVHHHHQQNMQYYPYTIM